MPEKERPLSTLDRLIGQRASGELICAAPDLEVHVFLQRGRVAWCTESGKPFAFTRKLTELTDLDRDTFRQILDECRRDRLPLGETLIQWRVASIEQVREALRHQIVDALESLVNESEVQVLFLERSREFAEYDEALTFELDDVLPDAATSRETIDADRSRDDDLDARLQRFCDEVTGLAWAGVVQRGTSLAWHPSTKPRAETIARLSEFSLDACADFVAVRAGLGTVIGAALADRDGGVWCGLGVDSTIGAAVSALTEIFPLDDKPAEGIMSTPEIDSDGDSPAAATVFAFMERARDVLGVALVDRDGSSPYRAVRGGPGLRDALTPLERRLPILEAADHLNDLWPGERDDDFGSAPTSVVTGEGPLWCFGAELTCGPSDTIWLLTGRGTSQGLGWAYLSALGRQLAHGETT